MNCAHGKAPHAYRSWVQQDIWPLLLPVPMDLPLVSCKATCRSILITVVLGADTCLHEETAADWQHSCAVPESLLLSSGSQT